MLIVPAIIIVLLVLSAISVVVVIGMRLDDFALIKRARSHSLIPRLVGYSFVFILEMRRLAALYLFVVIFLFVVDTSFVGRPEVFSLVGFVWALRRTKVKVRRLTRLRQITERGRSAARRVHHSVHSAFYL